MKKILTAIALCILSTGAAQAMHLNLMGGMNFSKITVEPAIGGTTYSAKGAISGGATIDFGIAPMFALEIGALSIGQSLKISSAAGDVTRTSRAIQIPLMFRFTALPMLEIGLGGYYTMLPSKYKYEASTNASFVNGEYTLDTATYEKSDYGVRGDVRFLFPVAPMTRILLNASYDMGLKDQDKTAAATLKSTSYALMAGASFGF